MKPQTDTAFPPLPSDTPVSAAAQRVARAIYDARGVSESYSHEALLAPLVEFLNRPGKRFRGALVAAAWNIAGGSPDALPQQLPVALELLHAGSLIIDDIEDGSSMRRNAPALHELFGVPLALNTGNWLYFASESIRDDLDVSPSVKLRLLRRLRAAVLSCHQGQGLDLSVKISTIHADEIQHIVTATTELKTASLLELAAALGAVAASAPDSIVSALARFGRSLGMALQMFDDLAGVTVSKRHAKGLEDLRGSRPTWIWAWACKLLSTDDELRGLQRMLRKVEQGASAEPLLAQLRKLVGHHGQLEASALMREAYRRLVASVPPSEALDELAGEIKRLEESYV